MEKELCEIIENILSKSNEFVLGLLRGDHHPDGRSQACENWIQVELAKELKRRHEKSEIQLEIDNYDLILKRGEVQTHNQIKINSDAKKAKKDIKSLLEEDVKNGYFIFLATLKDFSNKKYRTNEEQFLDRAVFKQVLKKSKEQTAVCFIKGNPIIAIGCACLT